MRHYRWDHRGTKLIQTLLLLLLLYGIDKVLPEFFASLLAQTTLKTVTRNYGRPTSGPRDSIKIVSTRKRDKDKCVRWPASTTRFENRVPLFPSSSSSQRNEKHWIVLWKFNGRRGWKRSLDEIQWFVFWVRREVSLLSLHKCRVFHASDSCLTVSHSIST